MPVRLTIDRTLVALAEHPQAFALMTAARARGLAVNSVAYETYGDREPLCAMPPIVNHLTRHDT